MGRFVQISTEDKRELLELTRIQNHDDFLSVLALIRRSKTFALESCMKLKGEDKIQASGVALGFTELLEALEDAKTIIDAPFLGDEGIEDL